MTLRDRAIKPVDDPYQSVLVLCHDCGHVSLQGFQDDKVYTCPVCGSTMKEVKV